MSIIKIFHDNEGSDNIYITNKLINSLFNDNLYNNNKDLINKLMNKIVNLGFDIDSSEIFLNIIQIYNDNDEKSASILIKKILNNMTDKDIAELLKNLKNTQYINIIKRVEVIFRHIIVEKNIKQYKNNEEIKNTLYELFKELTNLDKVNEQMNKKDENHFYKCILELISFIVQLSDNYVLNDDFFEKIEIFLNRLKKDELIIGVFKALFFEY